MSKTLADCYLEQKAVEIVSLWQYTFPTVEKWRFHSLAPHLTRVKTSPIIYVAKVIEEMTGGNMESPVERLDLGVTSTGFVFSSNDLVACYWRTRQGMFAIACFTPEGERVWQLRGLKREEAIMIAQGYDQWLEPSVLEI